MKIRQILLLVVAISSSVFCTGCVNLHAKSISQQQYFLAVEESKLDVSAMTKKQHTVNSKFSGATLEIYAPQIAPQFSGSNFVYRTSEVNYISDYYNIFFGFPSEQIAQGEIKYIQASNIFKYASDNIFPLKADYALKTNITELYADYRDKTNPKAVISIQYVLISFKDQPKIILNKTFSESVAITEKNSNALVDGWNKGLQEIFKSCLLYTSEAETV